MAMAQNGPLVFNMERTYFCQGETIQFVVDIPEGATGYADIRVVGPTGTEPSPYIFPNCTPAHTGVYQLLANYQGNPNYLMDEITITVIAVTVSATADDTYVSPGGGTTLHGYGADYYVWSPAQYLSDTIGESVQAIIPANIPDYVDCIDFTVTGFVTGDNRVTNGDFENGNNDVISAYRYRAPSVGGLAVWDNGDYTVHDDACDVHNSTYHPEYGCWHNPWNHDQSDCGSGKYMIVNGNSTPNTIVWEQTIDVRPNIDYAFSANVCSFSDNNRAILQFSINGTTIGQEYQVHSVSEGWTSFYALWTSGPNDHTATIRLIDKQTSNGSGNDFGVDNITFHDLMECSAETTVQVCIQREVEVGDIDVPAPICEGGTLEIDAPTVTVNGGSSSYTGHWVYGPSPGGPWQPLNGLSNIPASYDGMYLCYEVTHDGTNYYSNAVRITVIDFNVHITVTPNDTICAGETVVLEAVVDTIYPFAAVGDILCSDGSIVHRNEWPAPGKTPIGIVFYVDDSKWHGWAVSLTQTASMKWSTTNFYVNNHGATHWNLAINAEWEGYANTQNIISHYNAATYPAAWAADGFSTTYPAPWSRGWYLPSAAQLNMLFGELPEVNRSLNRVGATPIVDNNPGTSRPGGSVLLWSSTEGSISTAYALEIADGRIEKATKTTSSDKYYVRAVITF